MSDILWGTCEKNHNYARDFIQNILTLKIGTYYVRVTKNMVYVVNRYSAPRTVDT